MYKRFYQSAKDEGEMALSGEDWARLDDRLDRIFDKMEENRKAADIRMNQHSDKINAVSVVSVRAVADHEEKHHDPSKKWGLVAAITSIAASVGGGIAWALSKIKGGE